MNSLSQNKHCSLKIRAVRVLQTLCLLDPQVYTHGKWNGKEKEVGTIMSSSELLMFTKLIEMIFEALPQLILQVGALMQADSISFLPAASICLSVATAGFIISDLSVGIERGFMTDQFRNIAAEFRVGFLPRPHDAGLGVLRCQRARTDGRGTGLAGLRDPGVHGG